MRRGFLTTFVALAACSADTNEATDQKTTVLQSKDAAFVQAFMSTCVRDFENRQRVEAAAKVMKWKPITDPNVRRMLGPENNSSDWRGWAFKHDGAGFMLALSNSEIDGKPVSTCVLISELVSVQGTKEHLIKLLAARQPEKDEEGGQRTEVWKFPAGKTHRFLTFIDAEPMGMKMLNAGVSNDWTQSK